jgi:hypothetical protein
MKKVGTENVAEIGFFTRGLLIDVAALKGVTRYLRKKPMSFSLPGRRSSSSAPQARQ